MTGIDIRAYGCVRHYMQWPHRLRQAVFAEARRMDAYVKHCYGWNFTVEGADEYEVRTRLEPEGAHAAGIIHRTYRSLN